MNKFCVRCGALLEAPNANQKYCVVCAHNVQLEQQAK
nr:MAG TPA: RNA polymerase subunit [Caudoviricetes sp.]